MSEQDNNTVKHAHLTPLPNKVGVDGLEDKWRSNWDEAKTYAFHNSRDRKAVYSIDTPPPTVSGHLHVGHVFSYTHTDVIARYKRMQGFDVLHSRLQLRRLSLKRANILASTIRLRSALKMVRQFILKLRAQNCLLHALL